MDRDRAGAEAPPGRAPVSRSRRALMALSPAALGAAGLFVSGLRRPDTAKAAAGDNKGADESDRLTDHRKAYYDRARF